MKAQTMRRIRQYHLYLGLFFAPAILLFAFSGALQTLRLPQESGWGGPPPRWMVWMADVHKDQEISQPEPPKPAAKAGAAEKPKPPRAEPPKPARLFSPLPLKIFVVLLSIGLMLSTLLGITIALNSRATRRISIVMLVAGTVLPLLLLL